MHLPRYSSRNQPGLTLIEMLIAMALLAAIMGLVGNTLFQTGKFSEKSNGRIELRKKVRNLKNIIARDFTHAVYLDNLALPRFGKPRRASGIVGKKGATQETRHDRVFMHVNAPSLFRSDLDLADDPELHEVGYFLGQNEDGISYTLYRREDFYVDEQFDFPQRDPIQGEYLDSDKSITLAMVDDILFFEVQYLPDVKDATDQWLDEWDSATFTKGKLIPYTVKVKVVFPVLPLEEIGGELALHQGDLFSKEASEFIVVEEFQINLRWTLSSGVSWKF